MRLAPPSAEVGLVSPDSRVPGADQGHELGVPVISRKLAATALSIISFGNLAGQANADTSSKVSETASPSYLVDDGVWGTGTPSGIVIAIARRGESTNIASYSPSKDYVKVLLTDKISGLKQCVFLETEHVKKHEDDLVGEEDPDNPCHKYLNDSDSYSEYAKQVNVCPEGIDDKCVHGTPVDVIPACAAEDRTMWGKFAANAKDTSNVEGDRGLSGPSRKLGEVTEGKVLFRGTYPIQDKKGRFFSMVKSAAYGWGWIRRKCLVVPFNKSPIGGMPKEEDAVAGPSPYTG